MRLLASLVAVMVLAGGVSRAQAPEGALSQAEIDSLRDAAYVPVDRVRTYMKILDTREKQIDDLLAKRHGADFASEMHDLMDQMGGIADELNDNLDSYAARHRDLRKVLPKLADATEKWSTALRAPVKDERYDVVRKVALDALKDTRELAESIASDETTYFREHPEAAKAEKARTENPHAPQ